MRSWIFSRPPGKPASARSAAEGDAPDLTGLFRGLPLPADLDLVLLLKPSAAVVEIQQHQQPDPYETVREDRQEIVGGIVSFAQCLVQVAVCGPEHEERPAEPRRKPKRAANPKAQEAQEAPGSVVNSDLELERTSRGPADKMCRLIGEEDQRQKPGRQANDAYVQHEGIEQQQVNNAAAGPRTFAKAEVYQGKYDAQERDD